MMLKDFLKKRGMAAALSREISVSRSDISIWMNGKKEPPIKACVAIERATNGQVTRKDLRPHDWMTIWPELAGKGE